MPVPVTSRDCISPLAVKLMVVLADTALVGANRTVTVAVAPLPTRMKGLPESTLKGGRTETAPVMVPLPVLCIVNVRVAEPPIATLPKLTVPMGVIANSVRATALASTEHALSVPSEFTAVIETL